MTLRRMVVTRAPGSDDKPMVKIANRLLETMGFEIGAPIEVAYREGVITITKLEINDRQGHNVGKLYPLMDSNEINVHFVRNSDEEK